MVKLVQLNDGEKVVLEIRKHVFPFIIETLFLAVLVVLPPVIFAGSKWFDTESLLTGATKPFLLGYFTLLLFVWISFFIAWTNYYLDILIITNQRVIDIEQKRFFYRDIATLSLDKIEDIKVEVKGFLATILNYGTLNLQTAAESREFVVKNIPHPLITKEKIWDLHVSAVKEPQQVIVVK